MPLQNLKVKCGLFRQFSHRRSAKFDTARIDPARPSTVARPFDKSGQQGSRRSEAFGDRVQPGNDEINSTVTKDGLRHHEIELDLQVFDLCRGVGKKKSGTFDTD